MFGLGSPPGAGGPLLEYLDQSVILAADDKLSHGVAFVLSINDSMTKSGFKGSSLGTMRQGTSR